MALQTINPSETKAWKKLNEHFTEMKGVSMQEMFKEDALRTQKFHIQWERFLVDFSKNKINQKTIDLLLELANDIGLKEAIADYFSGENINQTEKDIVLKVSDNGSGFTNNPTPGMGIKLCEERIKLLNSIYKNSTILLHISPTQIGTTITIELKNWL